MADNQQDNVDIRFRFLTEGDQRVLDAIAKLRNETKNTASVADQLTTSFAKLSRENQLDSAIKNAIRLRDEMGNADEAARTLLKNLEEIGATSSEIEGAARKFTEFKQVQVESGGDGGGGGGGSLGLNGLRRTGGALNQLGLQPAGQIFQGAGDFGQIAKEFKEISKTIPFVTTAAEVLTPVLGASAAGFAAVALPLAPIVAILAAVAIGVKLYSDEIERNKKEAQAAVDALKEKNDLEQQNTTLVRSKTAEQNRQDAQDQSTNITKQNAYLNKLQADKAANDKAFADLGNSFNPKKRQELGDNGAIIDKAYEDGVKALQTMQAEFGNTVTVLGPAIDAFEKERKAKEAAIKATNDHATIITQNSQTELKIQNELQTLTTEQAKARLTAIDNEKTAIQSQIEQLSALPNRTGDVTEKLKTLGTQLEALNQESAGLSSGPLSHLPADIKAATTELEKLSIQIQDLEDKRSAQLANRVQEDQRAGEIGGLEGQIKSALEQEQARANADKITQIRAEGGDAEAKALMAQAAKINAINDNFFQNQLKAWNAFFIAEQRDTEHHNTERRRQVEDLNASLLNLAGQRDVAGFVNARSSGLTNLSRGDEDANTRSRERRQDYERQAAEADASRRQQLEALRVANNQENEARRTALNAKINQEIAAGQGQLKQSQILQAQLASLRQRYASEDLVARRHNEDEAYATQIGKLKQRQADLNAIIGQTLNPAVTLMSQLGNAVVDFINRVRNAASGSSGGSSSASHTPQGGYASGTNYVPRTGLYQLHQGEAVIPASQNRNYSPAWSRGRGGMNVTVNVAGVGSLVSTAELNATVESIVSGFERAAGVA